MSPFCSYYVYSTAFPASWEQLGGGPGRLQSNNNKKTGAKKVNAHNQKLKHQKKNVPVFLSRQKKIIICKYTYVYMHIYEYLCVTPFSLLYFAND